MPILGRHTRPEFERTALPHLKALYGVAVRLCHDQREAEDLVQDTMLRAYRFFHRFETDTNAKAWLFKILHNVFFNRYRKRMREHKLLEEIEHQDTYTSLLAAEPPLSTSDPERFLAGRMVAAEVQRALSEVPADFRMAVMLADLEDFSYREVAEIMDCPVGTVMSRLYRGRRILQRRLYDYAVAQGLVSPPASSAKPGHAAPPMEGAAAAPTASPEAALVADLAEWRARHREQE